MRFIDASVGAYFLFGHSVFTNRNIAFYLLPASDWLPCRMVEDSSLPG